jgi:hypothetical protein
MLAAALVALVGLAPGAWAADAAAAPAAASAAAVHRCAAHPPPRPARRRGHARRRIQDVKGDVIKLNRDLLVLEEELLFPANTQVALFVSMDVGKLFELDSVQIKLDDKVVASYLYTPLEVQALHRGGVQRVYLGNLRAGEHEIVAFFTGKGRTTRDYKRGATSSSTRAPTRSTSSCASRIRPASCSPSSTSRSGSDAMRSQYSLSTRLRRGLSAALAAALCAGAAAAPADDGELRARCSTRTTATGCSIFSRSTTSRRSPD